MFKQNHQQMKYITRISIEIKISSIKIIINSNKITKDELNAHYHSKSSTDERKSLATQSKTTEAQIKSQIIK
jgi:hypothetical protein